MRLKKFLLTGLGFIFLGLGAVGLLLPVWPTTPFVLLSFACFSSSPRMRAYLMKIAFFREHIENYESRKGLSQKTVRISLIWLWSMLLFSVLLTRTLQISLLLFLIGGAVTCHILWMARSKYDKKEKTE